MAEATHHWRLAAAHLGVPSDQLRRALKYAEVDLERRITLARAREALRAWHDRPVKPPRAKMQGARA